MLKPVEGNTKNALQNVCIDKNFLNRYFSGTETNLKNQ